MRSESGDGFRDDDSGLAPVVGIALLVGITLLLAASVAAFAVGLSGQPGQSDAPAAAFQLDYESAAGGPDTLGITHNSGDPVVLRQLYVDIEGATCAGGGDDPNGRYEVHSGWGFGPAVEEMQAGFSFQIGPRRPVDPMCSTGTLDLGGAVVRLVWQSPSGDSVLLREWTGP